LKFKFKVGHGPKPAKYRVARALFNVIDQQTVKTICRHVGYGSDDLCDQRHPLGKIEQWILTLVARHSHDYLVKELRGSLDHIQMTIGEGIETARINDRPHEPSLAVDSWKVKSKIYQTP